ncbi:MAG TPA: hypothetical protein VIL17_07560 [Coriobacteriia bacterium]
MKRGTTIALVSGALVAGMALGTVGIAFAAPSRTATGTAGFGAGVSAICRQAGGTIADIVAKVTGQSTSDVYAARAKGESFSAIAANKGVSATVLTDDVIAARKSALDAEVQAKTITRSQADAALANMKTRVSTQITSNAPGTCTGTGPGTGAAGQNRGQGGGRGMMGTGTGACGGAAVTQP